MTVLGKMMAFLVLVISLVFNFLTVSAYTTRTNWRAEAVKYKNEASRAADSANSMKSFVESEQIAAADAQRVLREERDSYYNQTAVLQKQLTDLNTLYNQAFTDANKQAAEVAALQANVAKLQRQIEDNDKMLASLTDQLNKQTLAAEQAKVEANEQRIEAQSRQQQVERLSQRVNQLNEELAGYKDRFGDYRPGDRGPLLPETFRGTVRRVQGDLVVFTPGLDAGVVKGATLSVARYGANPKYLGRITVLAADPKEASGRFTPPEGTRPGPDDYPRAGDIVTPR
jgi:uncharacterized phage infection (PIP) family protein YhgE